jgi:hypothetical protein
MFQTMIECLLNIGPWIFWCQQKIIGAIEGCAPLVQPMRHLHSRDSEIEESNHKPQTTTREQHHVNAR